MSSSYVDREKQLRSVFVGNIPFDVTEGELREKFEQAGPIVSFRLVHDRDSGKPKGYGFIEYQDAATANSCVRNLNNVEYNGRPLRVGPAAGGDQASAENIKALQQALGGLQQESPYGAPVEPAEAPEAISKAVSSLPPEQMFELMKQMKLCIQNNPNEARSMLLQNPQLAYALLQAQIVMKIVDPQVAMALLHREREAAPALSNDDTPKPVVPAPVPASAVAGGFRGSGGLLGERPGESAPPPSGRSGLLDNQMLSPTNPADRWGGSGGPVPMDSRNPLLRGPDSSMNPRGMDPRGGPPNLDPRSGARGMDPRGGPSGMDPRGGPSGMDPRGGPSGMDPRGGPSGMDPRGGPSGTDPRGGPSGMDHRGLPGLDPRSVPPVMDPRSAPPGMDPRSASSGMDPRSGHSMDPRREQVVDPRRDPRSMDNRGPPMDRRDLGARAQDVDYRNQDRNYNRSSGGLLDAPRDTRQLPGPSRGVPPPNSQFSPRQGGPSTGPPPAAAVDEDKEKAALIMQVLQLTDEQIQQLPPDQRQSILILKQQISRQQ